MKVCHNNTISYIIDDILITGFQLKSGNNFISTQLSSPNSDQVIIMYMLMISFGITIQYTGHSLLYTFWISTTALSLLLLLIIIFFFSFHFHWSFVTRFMGQTSFGGLWYLYLAFRAWFVSLSLSFLPLMSTYDFFPLVSLTVPISTSKPHPSSLKEELQHYFIGSSSQNSLNDKRDAKSRFGAKGISSGKVYIKLSILNLSQWVYWLLCCVLKLV